MCNNLDGSQRQHEEREKPLSKIILYYFVHITASKRPTTVAEHTLMAAGGGVGDDKVQKDGLREYFG